MNRVVEQQNTRSLKQYLISFIERCKKALVFDKHTFYGICKGIKFEHFGVYLSHLIT